ncbi:ATP-binding cassette domain-containing protein [Arcanobacterium haemolyticum]|nr:ATP-binding cassette domain-containing protein [Arcanobacterium haemolyticum]
MLAARNLTFGYKNVPIFNDLNLRFPSGRVSMIVGSSGSGKSTLLYVLGLLLTPQSGEVLIDGQPAAHLTDTERSRMRARDFGFVFQDASLDPSRPIIDSVIEPALYAGMNRREAYSRGMDLLESIGVEVRAAHRPGQISGGQAQRVAVARALMNEPRIILADEPTGNLDPENAAAVLDRLCETSKGEESRATIIVTHDTTILHRADHVVRLDELTHNGSDRTAHTEPSCEGVAARYESMEAGSRTTGDCHRDPANIHASGAQG